MKQTPEQWLEKIEACESPLDLLEMARRAMADLAPTPTASDDVKTYVFTNACDGTPLTEYVDVSDYDGTPEELTLEEVRERLLELADCSHCLVGAAEVMDPDESLVVSLDPEVGAFVDRFCKPHDWARVPDELELTDAKEHREELERQENAYRSGNVTYEFEAAPGETLSGSFSIEGGLHWDKDMGMYTNKERSLGIPETDPVQRALNDASVTAGHVWAMRRNREN